MTPESNMGEPASAASSVPRSANVVFAALMIVLAILWLLFWPTTQSLVAEWQHVENKVYTHGWLVAGVAAWLLYRKRGQLAQLSIRYSTPAALLASLTSLLWLITDRAGILLASHVLWPVLMWLGVWAVLGRDFARYCTFPISFLFAAVPVWNHGIRILQWLTIKAEHVLLQLAGVPAFIEGSLVSIASGSFVIAEGCSGLHFFIVAVAIGALYGELNEGSAKFRLSALVLAAVLAIVTNWVRVFVVIYAGYLTDMQHYLVRVDHYYFGWGVFGVAMFAFFAIARFIPEGEQTSTGVQRPEPATPHDHTHDHRILGSTLALCALAIGPLIAALRPPALAQTPNAALPQAFATWTGPSVCEQEWRPSFAMADVVSHGQYQSGNGAICMYVATYLSQSQGKELIGYGNSIIGESKEAAVSTSDIDLPDRALKEVRVAGGDEPDALLWYDYSIDAFRTSVPVIAQLRYATTSLFSSPASSVTAVRVPCVPDCEAARSVLNEFVTSERAHARAIIPKDTAATEKKT